MTRLYWNGVAFAPLNKGVTDQAAVQSSGIGGADISSETALCLSLSSKAEVGGPTRGPCE